MVSDMIPDMMSDTLSDTVNLYIGGVILVLWHLMVMDLLSVSCGNFSNA